MTRIDNLRLVGITGTNKVMSGELSRLARRAMPEMRLEPPKKQGLGALVYAFHPGLAEVAVNYHRTSSRVLWDLYESSARRLEPLYDELLADVSADDRAWLWSGASFSVRARNVQSFAAGERQVVGTVKNALIDGARARGIELRVDADAPDIHIAVRMHDGVLSVSVDLAGAAMHQRGYRVLSGDAPIRENLAAVLLMLSRYNWREDLLVDPMAGSGTIAIEAALMARAAPLFAGARQPAYLKLPVFAGYQQRNEALFADAKPLIVASDIDSRAVEMMRANAQAAGVTDDLAIVHADLRDLSPRVISKRLADTASEDRSGLILSNPPYGERLAGGELDLYSDMAEWSEQFVGYRAAFVVGNAEFETIFGRRPRVRKPIKNGSLRAYYCLYDL